MSSIERFRRPHSRKRTYINISSKYDYTRDSEIQIIVHFNLIFFSLLVAFGRLLLSLFRQNDSDFSYDRSYSRWTELYPFAHRYA